MDKNLLKSSMERNCKAKYAKSLKNAQTFEIWNCLSSAILETFVDEWENTTEQYENGRQAYYFSSEYLMGRAMGNNLISLRIYDEVKEVVEEMGLDLNEIEEVEEDMGLGNGGLGRLAACFMDSAATMNVPLRGYGIRYSNGLFEQKIENGQQTEYADEWLKYGDPWSIRRDELTVEVKFDDLTVKAVPYDTPIIAYGTKNVNTLRLFKCEPLVEFDFLLFNSQKYTDALDMKNKSENISRVLYPNDTIEEGKLLRLRQQYFMASAALKDIIRNFKAKHGGNFDDFAKFNAIQLNDTHPVLSIPEFVRILVDEEGLSFKKAMAVARATFAYTNHTILQEALEKWDINLINKLFKRVGDLIHEIDNYFIADLRNKGISEEKIERYKIIQHGNSVHMANLAIHTGTAVNGVAQLHTDILKSTELKEWYELYPEKFQNKTNGITPRRWLRYCNQELSGLITRLLGNEDWVKDLDKLKALENFIDDEAVLKELLQIKHTKKEQLASYIEKTQNITLNPDSIFDIQVKRLHEYKRQLLNALYILNLYYELKETPNKDMPSVTFIFGAKAFPGYRRAKGIVKFILQIQELVNNDPDVNQKMNVVFLENYRVSLAEKLFPAADVSKQISTAGKEASGTGNMKFMLNGAPTFGTYDGANVEIVAESKEENNFIFGLKVEDIEEIRHNYDAYKIYEENPDLKRVIDSLVNGTFDDGGTGEFKELYDSLVHGVDWGKADPYFTLADFRQFKESQERVFAAYKDETKWAKLCLMNIANAGTFSSDRTILQYAKEIWNVEPLEIQ